MVQEVEVCIQYQYADEQPVFATLPQRYLVPVRFHQPVNTAKFASFFELTMTNIDRSSRAT
jgi:hypothetical protein